MNARQGFHAGEQALQRLAGSHERLQALAPQILRDHMPEQHRELFGKLPTLLLGSLDAAGQPWATMLAGPPGFVRTPDARLMEIEPLVTEGDPVLASLAAGAPVGVLGLEPWTRRRNRMNGVVRTWRDGRLSIEVRQSFGNCPRYIVPREPITRSLDGRPALPQRLGPQLDAAARALVARNDTLFIATASARPTAAERSEGVDVSHRGGKPGFLGLEEDLVEGGVLLTLPDYAGNQFFMTLGNLSVNPAAGLLLVDYEEGGLLHLSAQAEIVLGGPAAGDWPGAQRLVRLRIRGGLWRPGALPWHWLDA